MSAATPSHYPYPGLRPFRSDESEIFFGREEHVDQLLTKLGKARFLAVIGPSGCGKSSLVRAGMIAALETGFMMKAGSRWRIAKMQPGKHPLQRLAEAVLQPSALGPERVGDPGAKDFKDKALEERPLVEAHLRRGPLGLAEVLGEAALPKHTNFLLLVDQFEEIFRYRDQETADEFDAFVRLLVETAAQCKAPIYVVITMRSDFLGHCAIFDGLPEAINESQFLTPRLDRDELRAAIEKPVRVYGGDVELALVNRLLNDMGPEPNQLPLMQHVLMRMCTRICHPEDGIQHADAAAEPSLAENDIDSVKGTLTLAEYEAVGGLHNALSNHADETFNRLNNEQQSIAQTLFRCLSEYRSDLYTRHPVPVNEVQAVADISVDKVIEVIEAFRDPLCSFITPAIPERLHPDTMLDISHESLIREWKRLTQWAQEEANSADTYRFLEQTARRWQKGEAALWGTPNLENALAWRQLENPTTAWAERYKGNFQLAIDFLEKSEQKRREQEEKEQKEQRQREEDLRQLAEEREGRAESERKRADEQVKANKKLVRLSIILGVACVFVAIAGLFGFHEWTVAKKHEKDVKKYEKRSRSLVSQSLTLYADKFVGKDPELAVLLAERAVSLTYSHDNLASREAQDKLDQALQNLRVVEHFELELEKHFSIALSPNGTRIFTSGPDGGTIRNIDDRWRHVSEIHRDGVSAATFSLDGQRLSTASPNSKKIRIWDADSGKEVASFLRNDGNIHLMTLSAEGKRLAAVGADNTVRIFDVDSKHELEPLPTRKAKINGITLSLDGQRLASASSDGTITIWNVDLSEELHSFESGTNTVQCVAFSPDGKRLAASNGDGQVKTWNMVSKEVLWFLPGQKTEKSFQNTKDCKHFRFSPVSNKVASVNPDGTVTIWDVDTGKQLLVLRGHSDKISDIAFRRGGEQLVTASTHEIKVWNIGRLKERQSDVDLKSKVKQVNFSGDGKYHFMLTNDNSIIIRDDSGQRFASLPLQGGEILSVAMGPHGRRLATLHPDGIVKLWNVTPGEMKEHWHTPHDPKAKFQALTFSWDGKFLVLVSANQIAKFLYTESGKEKRPSLVMERRKRVGKDQDGHVADDLSPPKKRESVDIALSRDGKYLAVAAGAIVQLWDVTTHKPLYETKHLPPVLDGVQPSVLDKHLSSVVAKRPPSVLDIAFSHDSKHFATASKDGTVKVWPVDSRELKDGNSEDEKQFYRIRHEEAINSIAFSPDGEHLATASADDTVKLWDLNTGKIVRELFHKNDVLSVAFQAEGKYIGTVSRDLLAKTSPAKINDLIAEARARLTRGWHPPECKKYLTVAQCTELAINSMVLGKQSARECELDEAKEHFDTAQGLDRTAGFDPEKEIERLKKKYVCSKDPPT